MNFLSIFFPTDILLLRILYISGNFVLIHIPIINRPINQHFDNNRKSIVFQHLNHKLLITVRFSCVHLVVCHETKI